MTERAWIDAGADYIRRDEAFDAGPDADDLAEPRGGDDDMPEPPAVGVQELGLAEMDREALPF